MDKKLEKATFAAGCFWHVEHAFRKIKGVVSTTVGYTGGHTENPTYRQVCGHNTGHAEALELEFDPAQVSYEQLLDLFWSIHNPTTRNRQGPDIGSQYRSAIFATTPEQKRVAAEVKAKVEASHLWDDPIVTEIVDAGPWTAAESYHQDYLQKNPDGYTCHYLR